MRHRGRRDVVDPAFMGPRVGDRLFNSLLLILIFYRVGAKETVGNAINIPYLLQVTLARVPRDTTERWGASCLRAMTVGTGRARAHRPNQRLYFPW